MKENKLMAACPTHLDGCKQRYLLLLFTNRGSSSCVCMCVCVLCVLQGPPPQLEAECVGLVSIHSLLIVCVMCALQGPPPQLEAECGGRHFSRGMREVVASCLNKDPAKRPTAKQLLSKG
jgi:hypothetical protein